MNQQMIILAGGARVVVDWQDKNKCSACGAEVYWCITRRGCKMPINLKKSCYWQGPGYNADGIFESHFASCPKGKNFRKPKVENFKNIN